MICDVMLIPLVIVTDNQMVIELYLEKDRVMFAGMNRGLLTKSDNTDLELRSLNLETISHKKGQIHAILRLRANSEALSGSLRSCARIFRSLPAKMECFPQP